MARLTEKEVELVQALVREITKNDDGSDEAYDAIEDTIENAIYRINGDWMDIMEENDPDKQD